MEHEYYVCTGCALLCDDIEIEVNNGNIVKINNACLKGVARLKDSEHSMQCTINSQPASIQDAIAKAADILSQAEKPLLFGMGNSTTQAQNIAIQIAIQTNAFLDDTSSFCHGPIVEQLLKKTIKTCTLDTIRDKADVIVYWGADPANSHPRHLSKYTYFPRGIHRQRGWEEDRTAISIDIRKSHTAAICGDNFHQIPPQADAELLNALTDALSDKVPKVTFNMSSKTILELASRLKKAEFGVICAGLGLVYSLPDLNPLIRFMEALNEVSEFSLLPMAGQYNMRGFNHALYEQTGFVNRIKFTDNHVDHGAHNSIVELLRTQTPDAALIMGSDPMSSLPGSISKQLLNIPVIAIDPCPTLTSRQASITIPCATTGPYCGGSAIRMDGVEVTIPAMVGSNLLCDADILGRILEAL